jgi:hypothetical protein
MADVPQELRQFMLYAGCLADDVGVQAKYSQAHEVLQPTPRNNEPAAPTASSV